MREVVELIRRLYMECDYYDYRIRGYVWEYNIRIQV